VGRVFHGHGRARCRRAPTASVCTSAASSSTGGARKNRLVAAGYNGFLPGTPHVSPQRDGHEQATVHAEQNAIADAARRGSSVEGCVAYVTHYPCINCAKIHGGGRHRRGPVTALDYSQRSAGFVPCSRMRGPNSQALTPSVTSPCHARTQPSHFTKSLAGLRCCWRTQRCVMANFRRSVILMSAHDAEGAMGVVLNRPSGQAAGGGKRGFCDGPAGRTCRFICGGPVETGAAGCSRPGSRRPDGFRLHFGLEPESARRNCSARGRTPWFASFLGYSGWSAGQLEGEIDPPDLGGRRGPGDLLDPAAGRVALAGRAGRSGSMSGACWRTSLTHPR
jgi:hypothetical protein